MAYRGVEYPNIKNDICVNLHLYPYANEGRMSLTCIRHERKGRAVVAKDMSGVYADMLTKELVRLRAKHTEAYQSMLAQTTRKAKAEAANRKDLIEQINAELANRVANFNIFV